MKIVFALLAHGKPSHVERLARTLASLDHCVALHFDLNSPAADYHFLVSRFANEPRVRFARRVRVDWGRWSVVQGTLNCLDEIEAAGWEPDYVFHLSGLDYPIRPSHQLVAFLNRNRGDEFIESVPSDDIRWVKTGPQRERYRYRWYFNWRSQARRSDLAFSLQKILHLERPFVRNLTPHIGSQWWVLTWASLRRIMELGRAPDIRRFFKTVLVPDELFFQTMLAHVSPGAHVVGCSLTLYHFTDYGYPVVFHADHLECLLRQPFFMVRKLSQHSDRLRDQLDVIWRGGRDVAPFDDLDVGISGPDYEDWRLTYRNGPPGRPLVARSEGRWYEDQKRLAKPYFAVIGTSAAELRVVHRALSWHPDLLCHGQLFHPAALEFADGRSEFAGYRREDLKLRDVSAPNFVADVVRAEERRLSGLLLRWGQGWHMSELMFDRPNIRVIVVRGDPLIAFVENVLGSEPLLDDPFDLEVLHTIPPQVMANRFRRFLGDYVQHLSWLGTQADKGDRLKPRGWTARIDVADVRHDWIDKLEDCLGISLAGAPEAAVRDTLARELDTMAECRDAVTEILASGGIGRVVLDTLQRRADNPAIAVSLM